MNTKFSNQIQINPEFESLFSFENLKEKNQHNAQMISFRILSEVERVCELKNLKKKDLALKIGTSKSYITQLFRGNKSINTQIMAKFEEVLSIKFEIEAVFEELEADFIVNTLNLEELTKRTNDCAGNWFYCYNSSNTNKKKGDEIVRNLETENQEKQAA